MGLDDIDEDVPVTHGKTVTTSVKRGALDDLFDGLGGGKEVAQAPISQPTVTLPRDPLDSLFSDTTQAHSGAPKPSDDLFDFSKPTSRKQHNDGASFLDLFESGGRQPVAHNTLSSVSTPSTSKVTAHFLNLMNFYDVLGVDRTSDIDEIRRKYKRKALELHPDKVGSSQSTEEAALFKMITKAYETLSDETKRREYDLSIDSTGDGNWLQHV